MKIGIDFDRVLFDTDGFKQVLKEELDGFEETYKEAHDSNDNYSGEKHVELMDVSEKKYYEVFNRCSEFLYSDIKKLERLKEDFELFIVSRGEENYQRLKIENSGADKFFDKVIIVEEGSKDKVDIDFLVDDRKKEVERVEVPSMLFNREKHDAEDLCEKVRSVFS